MAGYRDLFTGWGNSGIGSWLTPTDELIRQAQNGNAGAIRELTQRGVRIPMLNARLSRDMGRPAATGGSGMPGMERPEYLGSGMPLPANENPGISRDMARPAAGASPEAIAFERAGRQLTPGMGMPEPEMPHYLGVGIGASPDQAPSVLQARLKPQVSPAQAEISALANGNDAAASIQRGAAQADEAAGVGDATSALPEPIRALTEAFANEEDDPYEGAAADLMKEITAGINPERNRNMALAQAGFAMAASGAPYFFQGVGIGGQAGLKAYTEAQDRDTLARIRAAQIGTDLSQARETKRAHRAGEGLELGRLTESVAENQRQQGRFDRTQTETERAARARERLEQSQLGLSAQAAATSAAQLKIAQDRFLFEQRQYEEGKSDDAAIKAAQVDYYKAQTEAQKALGLDRSTELYIDKDDTLMRVPVGGGDAEPVMQDGKPLKVQPKGSTQTAAMKNAKYYADLGLFGSERDAAAAMLQGKSMTPDRRLAKAYEMADGQLAYRPELFGERAVAERDRLAQQYFEILGGDAAPAEQTTAPTSPQQPSGASAGSDTPPIAGARKAPDGNWYVPDPARPGKYLKVE